MNFNICQREDNAFDLTVKVIDGFTGDILQDAHVIYSNNHSIGAITDRQGIAFLESVPYGTELTVSYVGFHNSTFTVDSKYKEVRLQLDDALDTVVITNDPKPEPTKGNGFGWWWLVALAGLTLAANSKGNDKSKKPINVEL